MTSSPPKILIVEDEPKVAAVLRKGLTDERFDVAVATTIGAAWEAIKVSAYDLVILDVMLPDGDGFDLCRRVRQSGENVPILMLSARSLVVDRVRGLDTGADDYLTKPFDYAELSSRVRALLRRGLQPSMSVLTVADLSLDPATRLVKRGDRRIDLTLKQFALLEYLMRNAGQAVTRQMLAQHVWDFTWHRLTNVIDVFINHLRKKIERPGEPKLIHAVRGVGYVIRDSNPND